MMREIRGSERRRPAARVSPIPSQPVWIHLTSCALLFDARIRVPNERKWQAALKRAATRESDRQECAFHEDGHGSPVLLRVVGFEEANATRAEGD